MEFILENYIIIIIVGLFFVFALIGYLIDVIRKPSVEDKEIIPNEIKKVDSQMNITNINTTEINPNNADSLLLSNDNKE